MKSASEGMRLMRKSDMEFSEIEQEQYMLVLLLYNQEYERLNPNVMCLEKEFQVNLMQEVSTLKLVTWMLPPTLGTVGRGLAGVKV